MTDTIEGTVTEILPNNLYRVDVGRGEGKEIMAYSAGKLRVNKIRIFVGNRVDIIMDPHGGKTTNRIVRRKDK